MSRLTQAAFYDELLKIAEDLSAEGASVEGPPASPFPSRKKKLRLFTERDLTKEAYLSSPESTLGSKLLG